MRQRGLAAQSMGLTRSICVGGGRVGDVGGRGAFSDALLALGLILSGASQLRIGGLPIGPGEACLAAWIALNAVDFALGRRWTSRKPIKIIGAFWLTFLLAQCLGLIAALLGQEDIDWSLVVHDIVAFSMMASITIIVLGSYGYARRLRRTLVLAMLFGTLSLSLQLASSYGLITGPAIDPWYWDRLRGWSDNPNQLSLFCAILVPMALLAAETAEGIYELAPAMTCAASSFAAGFLTKGNTFRLSLALGLLIALVATGVRILTRERGSRGMKSCVCLVFVLVPGLAVSVMPYVSTIRGEDIAKNISRDQDETLDEAALRFELWGRAIQRGLDSDYLGLGPGSHVPVPAEVIARQNWDVNPVQEALGAVAKHGATMESHNTYFEIFSEGGLLLIVSYVCLLLATARHVLKAGISALFILLSVIVVFGTFHVILRHPVVWFGLCLCLAFDRHRNEVWTIADGRPRSV